MFVLFILITVQSLYSRLNKLITYIKKIVEIPKSMIFVIYWNIHAYTLHCQLPPFSYRFLQQENFILFSGSLRRGELCTFKHIILLEGAVGEVGSSTLCKVI